MSALAQYQSVASHVDCLVVGGGITGAGVAREAALRGLRVTLIDEQDFASGTSHLSSKLIHGGLRYFAQGHLREAARLAHERNCLLTELAPHLVRPLKFVMPFTAWQWYALPAGVPFFRLYDRIGGHPSLARASVMFRSALQRECPLLDGASFAWSYWDARTSDARLVLAVLRSAERAGASLYNYTTIVHAQRVSQGWRVRLAFQPLGTECELFASVIVNAAGPWVTRAAEMLGRPGMAVRMSKGTHIVLQRPADFGDCAVVLRGTRDHRPMFAAPWEGRVLVGTTESPYAGDPRRALPESAEVDDLLDTFRAYFPAVNLTRRDVVCAYSGVRPIIDESDKPLGRLSRRHQIETLLRERLVTVAGGKLTTFRLMAQHAVDEVASVLECGRSKAEARTGNGQPHRQEASMIPPDADVDDRDADYAKAGERHTNGTARISGTRRVRDGMSLHADIHNHGSPGVEVRSTEEARLTRLYGLRAAAQIVEQITRTPLLAERAFDPLPYTLAELAWLAVEEKVVHLSDLLKRRSPIHYVADPTFVDRLPDAVAVLAPLLGWTETRAEVELQQYVAERRAEWNAWHTGNAAELIATPLGTEPAGPAQAVPGGMVLGYPFAQPGGATA